MQRSAYVYARDVNMSDTTGPEAQYQAVFVKTQLYTIISKIYQV